MSRREPHFVSRYFLKMMLSYCLVIMIGLGLVSVFTTTWVTNRLTEKEARVDREIVLQVRDYSDEKYRTIQNIFAQLYIPMSYYGNNSVIDYLDPRKPETADRKTKQEVVSGFLQDVCSANRFIADIFIADYGDREIFFFSNIPGRDPSLDYDFFSPGLPGGEVDNKTRFVSNHIPPYINKSSVNNFEVLSYCIYLFDRNAIRFSKPLGYIVVNVKADHFREAIRTTDGLNGTLFVTDGNGTTLFDSSGGETGTAFRGETFGITDFENPESSKDWVINTQKSEKTGYRFINIVSADVIRREAGSIRRSLYGVLLACVGLALIISFVSARLFSRRINRLVQKMRLMDVGEFTITTDVKGNDEISYLEQSFNSMITRLDKHIQTAYVYQLESKTAELKALQAQINPHFLFNTLESIRFNALEHQDADTAKMIHLLGNLFRWNIQSGDLFVELRQEINYAGTFIELQKLRYEDAFDFTTDVPQKLLSLGVPKFILQPLVENAIKHGQKGVTSGGIISISARISEREEKDDQGGTLEITVEDNGHGMDEETVRRITERLDQPEAETDDHYSIGLSNVHRRIRILFGEPYGLTIGSEPGVRTTVRILMPARRKEELEAYVQSNHRG
jgi:two-component system sensor histidine kinase YesM